MCRQVYRSKATGHQLGASSQGTWKEAIGVFFTGWVSHSRGHSLPTETGATLLITDPSLLQGRLRGRTPVLTWHGPLGLPLRVRSSEQHHLGVA